MLLRTEVIDFIRDHPDDFAPYMEDEEDFTSYCKRMSKVYLFQVMYRAFPLFTLQPTKYS